MHYSSKMAYCTVAVFISFVCSLQAALTLVAPSSVTVSSITMQNTSQVTAVTAPFAGCTCGVFLTGQFVKGKQPMGYAPINAELDDAIPCSQSGVKQCMTKCVDLLAKHLGKSIEIICASIDRDCFRERAYLFVKNCNNGWVNTNLSAGREYCCKAGEYYKCPT